MQHTTTRGVKEENEVHTYFATSFVRLLVAFHATKMYIPLMQGLRADDDR